MQMRSIALRRVQIIRGNPAPQIIQMASFLGQALLMGSVFFKLDSGTRSYFSRGGTLFFSVLFGALSSMAEIPSLYAQRPIVARHEVCTSLFLSLSVCVPDNLFFVGLL